MTTDDAPAPSPVKMDEALREHIATALWEHDTAGLPLRQRRVESLMNWPKYLAAADAVMAVVEPLARQVERVEALCDEFGATPRVVGVGLIRAALSATDSGSADD